MLDFASVLQFFISCAFQKHKSRFDLSFGVFSFFSFFLRSWLWEHHAESLPTPVIFLNIVMAQMNFVQMTSISWMAYPVKTILRTAMKDAVRHMIISADICSHQVDPVIIY